MTRTYKNIKTGKELDINISGGEFLDKVTLGLWQKLGCYPRSPQDCKLVARTLKNYLGYQDISELSDFRRLDIIELDADEIEFFDTEVIPFFENAEEGVYYPNVESNPKKMLNRKIELPAYCSPFDSGAVKEGDPDCDHDYPPESMDDSRDRCVHWTCSKCGRIMCFGIYD